MQNKLAVSSWSIHRALGRLYENGPGARDPETAVDAFGPGRLAFAEMPAELARRGYGRAELCHFHLASRDAACLGDIRAAFVQNNVIIQTLLIDDGDLTDPDHRARDMAWIASWIEAAARLGAKSARVIAGKRKPDTETLALAVEGLAAMAAVGKTCGVRIVTENWFDLLSGPDDVNAVLDALGGDVGFLADTGNWEGPQKYGDLKSVFTRAELCHAKAGFDGEDELLADDYGNCLRAAAEAGYKGPMTLIYEGDGDEWQGLERERAFIRAMA